jgi:hypothetical protein
VDSFKKIGDIERMGRIDSVAAAEEKQEQKKNNNTVITLETATTTATTTTDPWMLFLYALKARLSMRSIVF